MEFGKILVDYLLTAFLGLHIASLQFAGATIVMKIFLRFFPKKNRLNKMNCVQFLDQLICPKSGIPWKPVKTPIKQKIEL